MASKPSAKKAQPRGAPPRKRASRPDPDHPGVLFENNPDPMWLYDRATLGFLKVNAAAVEKYGYSRAEFDKMTIKELFDGQEVKRLAAQLQQSRLKAPLDGPWRHVRKDGRGLEVEITSLAVQLKEQKAVLVSARDVTEQKQAEEKLEGERILLRTLIDNLPDRIYVMDEEGRKVVSNRADWEAVGAKQMEDVIGKTDLDMYPPALAEEYWALDRKVMHSGRALLNHEERGLDPEGNPVWVLSSKVPLRDAHGKIRGLVGVGRDVTERRRAQEETKLFRALLDHSNDAFEVIDPETGKYLDMNNKACLDLGYTREELLGLSVFDIDPTVSSTLFPLSAESAAALPPLVEGVHRRKDRSTFPVEVSFRYAQLDRSYVIAVVRDITERRRAEEALRKSERVLREAEKLGHTGSWEQDLVSGEIFNTEENLRLFFGDDRSKGVPFEDYPEAVHPDDRDYVLQRRVQLLTERGPGDIEYRVIWPDGSVHVIFGRATVVRDDLGQAIRVYGTNVDITEQKGAETRIKRQLRRLSALQAIDQAISSSFDLQLSLNILLAQTINELGVDAASVLVLNKFLNQLEYAAGAGFSSRSMAESQLKVGEGIAGRAALERRTMVVPDLRNSTIPYSNPQLIADEKFVAFFAVPLVARGQVKGVMQVYHRSRLDPDAEWLDFLETLGGQAAIAIDSAQTFSELQRSNLELSLAYDATIEGWSRAMDLRDKETEGHTQRVTDAAMNLARVMGLPEQELTHMRRGALLHDIGKIGVPDAILLKPGPLTEDEWVLMKRHPALAYDMLSQVRYLEPALNVPYCHHEKWDGTGYPRGLKGEEIPLVARIFAVVDVWDALTSDRPYRAAWTKVKTGDYIREQSGKHFDPSIVESFLKIASELDPRK